MIASMQDEVVSKTRRKQAMLELQALGEALVALGEAQLAALPLEDELREAVLEAKRMRSHEAKRRQMQFIGRLMRRLDPAPIRERLDELAGQSAQASARHKRLEAWRERLLADDAALTEFAAAHPGADLQALRALIRNSRKERHEAKPPRAYRELFRFLKQCSASSPS
jgi:ribosome-associated protein